MLKGIHEYFSEFIYEYEKLDDEDVANYIEHEISDSEEHKSNPNRE